MVWTPIRAEGWPSPEQKILIRAAVLDGADALTAWREWRQTNDLASVDEASFPLLPQVYLNLRHHGLSASDLGALASVYRWSWSHNQLLLRGLASALKSLRRASVATMVIKGVPLALFHYHDIAARTMSDADLLIREEDLPAALLALGAAGWRYFDGGAVKFIGQFQNEIHLDHNDWRTTDLHWHLFPAMLTANLERDWWERSRAGNVLGEPTRVPEAEDLLFMILVGGRRLDEQTRARWIVDAATVAKEAGRPVDWLNVVEQARGSGLMLPLQDTLSYLENELPQLVAPSAVAAVMGYRVTPDDALRYERLSIEGQRVNTVRGVLGARWWRYAAVCRARGRMPGWPGFVSFLWRSYRLQWRARHLWQMFLLIPYRAAVLMVLGRRQPPATAKTRWQNKGGSRAESRLAV